MKKSSSQNDRVLGGTPREKPSAGVADRAGDEIDILHDYAVQLLSRSTLDEIFWLIAHQVMQALGFEDCVIYLVEGDGKLHQKAAYGPKNPSGKLIKDPIIIEMGNGIVGSAAALQVAQRVSDVRRDSRYIIDDELRGSELAVPIVYEGRTIGVIDSEHSEAGFYTHAHERFLLTVANMTAARITDAIKSEVLEATVRKLELTQETLMRQTEELTRSRASEQEANSTKTTFISMMSHELRTPLNAILGLTESLQMQDQEPARAQLMLQQIAKAGQDLAQKVTNLLTLGDVDPNTLKPEISRVTVRHFLAATAALAAGHQGAPKDRIEITVRPPGLRASLDINRTQQILLALLSNALKFSKDHAVQLSAGDFTRDNERWVMIRVEDRGKGIAPDTLRSVFEPFFRADTAYSRETEGAGLGLALAEKLAKLIGAELAIESSLGEGTRVQLSLPPASTERGLGLTSGVSVRNGDDSGSSD